MEDKKRDKNLREIYQIFGGHNGSPEERLLRAIFADGFNEFYFDLLQHYFEPHRAYHNLRHIDHCFTEFSEVRRLASNPDVMEIAIWLHDAVYDTHATDNEEKSAQLAQDELTKYGFLNGFINSVKRLILATKHTGTDKLTKDAKLLVDIDLAILGQPEEAFDEYERQIRQEYAWVPEEIYRAERAKILKLFLDRPTIYCTEHFQKKYEAQAQANLERSIAKLKS